MLNVLIRIYSLLDEAIFMSTQTYNFIKIFLNICFLLFRKSFVGTQKKKKKKKKKQVQMSHSKRAIRVRVINFRL